MPQLTDYQRVLIDRYRNCFTNTGGNNIEELLERKVSMQVNMPVAVLQVAAVAQLQMLERLVQEGVLPS